MTLADVPGSAGPGDVIVTFGGELPTVICTARGTVDAVVVSVTRSLAV